MRRRVYEKQIQMNQKSPAQGASVSTIAARYIPKN